MVLKENDSSDSFEKTDQETYPGKNKHFEKCEAL